jgi:hydrogenase maturation protease
MMRVVIIGLGNVLVGDDAFGPYVVRTLDAAWDMAEHVEVLDLGTPGSDLGPHIAGTDAVIFIDTVRSDGEPGTVRCYRKHELVARGPTPRSNPHQPSLVDTLLFLELQDVAPEQVLLIGAVPARYDTGAPLSEPVRAAVPAVIELVLHELERLGCPATLAPAQRPPDIWWEEPVRRRVVTT